MTYLRRLSVLAIVLLSIQVVVHAQPQTLYHMRNVPQGIQMNPAFQPACNVFVGIPGANSIYVNGGNTAFSLSDALHYEPAIDSMVMAMHPRYGFKDQFYNVFKKGNYMQTEMKASILSFGFRINKDWYFTFENSVKTNFTFGYPKELMKFVLYGNAGTTDTEDSLVIPLKNFGIRLDAYHETAFGLSREFSDELTIGARIKILNGIVNVNTKTNGASLTMGTDRWYYDKPVHVNVGGAIPNIFALDSAGMPSVDSNVSNNIMNYATVGSAFNNMGLALDLGVDYRPSDRLSLSASLVDFGFIHYGKKCGYNFQTAQDTSFQGVYVTPNLASRVPAYGQATLDTLATIFVSQFKQTGSQGAYNSYLTWKLYLGANYFIWPDRLSVGVLSRTQMYFKRIYEQVTVSANFFPIKGFSTSLSYSVMNNNFSNIGLGMNFKAGPVNLYFVGDYMPLMYSAGYIPYKERMFNFQLGMNLLFGCGKKIKDRPMIDSY